MFKRKLFQIFLVLVVTVLIFFTYNNFIGTSKEENTYSGKDWLAIGDSITAFEKYQKTVKKIVGFDKVTIDGVGGSTLASSGKGDKTSIVYRVQHMDVSHDVITIFGGTNDWGNVPARPLGKMGDTDENTVYGAIESIIKSILRKNPEARLIFITPLQRDFKEETDEVVHGWSQTTTNEMEYRLEDVVSAINEVCSKYSIPVLDLYHNSGITMYNFDYMTKDGLHPNNKGMKRIGEQIGSFINGM
ncbi:SGNH/GDSL hydrolase family protein [Sporosarcina sp. E16_8]|uniref:SGNH/GDSL hydrolase family protein n=1 Tax=Sporosarcina sp. E16_8 TaxID=2789295 RepID=UPI001A935C8A|nr:SGNH/GDSL hydrolase family protein [Sporosarcina sp. E16_8]MBO0586106.1 SGNH/GDSL hydrolase family protein [Sporosarcina sp. E16_8]